ncbi:MAG: creatininase family protein [Alphaproteobacteria bacterium]|nr:creatininase family protein [Alphaproteobacteria bacterium]
MLLQLSTWAEVENYLRRSVGVIVPIGSTEQHGPSGLIGTDTICPEFIARRFAEEAGAMVAPSLSLGVAQFNLGFPGTVSVRAKTLIAVIEDVVASLVRHGFQRIYFLNGHGGNIAPARAAFQDIYAGWSLDRVGEDAPVRCRLRSWWELPEVERLRKELYASWEGMHATPSEVAITQFAHPNHVKTAPMAAPRAVSSAFLRDHAGDNHVDAAAHRRRFPDGRVGSDPARATPEHGRRLVAAAVAGLTDDYAAFLAEAS